MGNTTYRPFDLTSVCSISEGLTDLCKTPNNDVHILGYCRAGMTMATIEKLATWYTTY
jgi:hypothetical protein